MLVRVGRMAMRVFGMLVRAGGVALRLYRVAVSMVMSGFVVMMSRRGMVRRRKHVMLVSGM